MANLGVSPVFKAYNTDGTVLASGVVYTYITGTSTGKNTYADAAQSSNNGTSFTLDSNGEAVVYFLTDTAYKLIIKTSGGTTVRTIDPYRPVAVYSSLDQNLDVNGYGIVSSSNGNIAITPHGTGSVVLDGLSWPQADGTNGQLIKTNGSGQLSFVTASTDVVNDLTPQLGGDLDCNSYNIQFDDNTGILDDSGNEQLIFQKTASAVNQFEMTNAITGNPPILSVAGGDTNIHLSLAGKGTGAVKISGLAYPTADGTNTQCIVTNGSGTLSFSTPGTAATQSDMETATSSTTFVTPAVMKYHPGVAKGAVTIDMAGAVQSGFGYTSVADNGAGDFTITWSNTFSSATSMYALCSITSTNDSAPVVIANTTTTTQVKIYDLSAGTVSETGTTYLTVVIFGDI